MVRGFVPAVGGLPRSAFRHWLSVDPLSGPRVGGRSRAPSRPTPPSTQGLRLNWPRGSGAPRNLNRFHGFEKNPTRKKTHALPGSSFFFWGGGWGRDVQAGQNQSQLAAQHRSIAALI